MKGGFGKPFQHIDDFCWNNFDEQRVGTPSDKEKYQRLIDWSLKARGRNPDAFDALTDWLLDDSQWTADRLAENEQLPMNDVLARFRAQNARLRESLVALAEPGLVNQAVWQALDRFDVELQGKTDDPGLQKAVADMFSDFSRMTSRATRALIAGNRTGPDGTDSVEIFGYINRLKDCDAGVQGTLFMPQVVQNQQNGFWVERFAYKTMPAMRFIGKEWPEQDAMELSKELVFSVLDQLEGFQSGFDYDMLLAHHFGKGVDVEPCHKLFGRFMKADTPVPQGFTAIDFIPRRDASDFGLPYLSRFAFATFAGDRAAMHRQDGYDDCAMYDVTRNIILGQGVLIPYPDKYWTAEVFLNGVDQDSTAYLFGVER